MDVDTAWQNFRQANIAKAENQTSVDDKLDVILAQQQEILNDTSRVADLVPLVTGDKAEEDALDETGDLEGQEQNPEGGMPEAEGEPMSDDMSEPEEEGDNPFAFLDEEDTPEEEESTEGEPADDTDDYEETEEDSDIIPDDDISDGDTEEPPTDEEDDSEEVSEDVTEESEQSDESDSEEEEGYISFDSLADEDEESDEEDTKKSVKEIPRTKTIKSIGSPTPMTVVKSIQKPTTDYSYGRASSAEQITDMLLKANGYSDDDDFQIGYGVDPHKAVEKDWAEYRLMKKLNASNLF